jgi:hypothetical protein
MPRLAVRQMPRDEAIPDDPPVGRITVIFHRQNRPNEQGSAIDPRRWGRQRTRHGPRESDRAGAGERDAGGAAAAFGRPPFLPRARAASRPDFVRSRIRFRSNSASAPKMWNTSLPPGVVVLIDSWRLQNSIPARSISFISSIRCLSDRPRRSNRQTTKTSPFRSWSRARSRGHFRICTLLYAKPIARCLVTWFWDGNERRSKPNVIE